MPIMGHSKVSYRIFPEGGGEGREGREEEGGGVDACKGHVHASVHPLGFCRFNKIVDMFKHKNQPM